MMMDAFFFFLLLLLSASRACEKETVIDLQTKKKSK
jgi:hypothetical protein